MSAIKAFHVELTDEEFEKVSNMYSDSSTNVTLKQRCKILMDMDEAHGEPALTHRGCAQLNNISSSTVATTLKKYREEGIDSVLSLNRSDKSNSARRKLDEQAIATIIRTATGPVPEGNRKWTYALLERHLSGILENPVKRDTIVRVLKQNGVTI